MKSVKKMHLILSNPTLCTEKNVSKVLSKLEKRFEKQDEIRDVKHKADQALKQKEQFLQKSLERIYSLVQKLNEKEEALEKEKRELNRQVNLLQASIQVLEQKEKRLLAREACFEELLTLVEPEFESTEPEPIELEFIESENIEFKNVGVQQMAFPILSFSPPQRRESPLSPSSLERSSTPLETQSSDEAVVFAPQPQLRRTLSWCL